MDENYLCMFDAIEYEMIEYICQMALLSSFIQVIELIINIVDQLLLLQGNGL